MISAQFTRFLLEVVDSLPKFAYVRQLTTPTGMKRLVRMVKTVAAVELGDERGALEEFFKRCLAVDPGSAVVCEDMHQLYIRFCGSTGLALMPPDKFFRAAAQIIRQRLGIPRRNDLKKERRWRRGFVGLKLTEWT